MKGRSDFTHKLITIRTLLQHAATASGCHHATIPLGLPSTAQGGTAELGNVAENEAKTENNVNNSNMGRLSEVPQLSCFIVCSPLSTP